VQADNGIIVQVDVTTDVGVLTLDADSENSSSQDSHNKLAITGARTLTAKTVMTLDATNGGIVRSGSGTMTLLAAAGIVLKMISRVQQRTKH
jgi:hypothetical protein